MKKMYHKISVT